MGLLAKIRAECKGLWNELQETVQLRIQLMKAETIEWVSVFFAHIFFLLFFSMLLFILLLIAVISIGIYITEWSQSAGLGFSFSTIMLLFILSVVWKLKTRLIIMPVKRFFIGMFKNGRNNEK
jgi:hypothetical protein